MDDLIAAGIAITAVIAAICICVLCLAWYLGAFA